MELRDDANTASADYKVNRAIPLLFALIAVSIGATLLILLLPRLLLGTRLPKQQGVFLFLMYFLCLGAGYILIQVALIQKFVLLLGHPTYALTVIVFSMLVASRRGKFLEPARDRRRRRATDAGAGGSGDSGCCAGVRGSGADGGRGFLAAARRKC